ncbi:MAG: 50S ribosomal protein L3, partial [Planctomycetota bacterium]
MNLNMGLLGRKIGMTQIYDADGTAVPVTAIDAGPCTVLQIRTQEKEGYSALQLGFDSKPGRNVPEELLKRAQGARARYELEHGRTSKPMRGHFFKVGEIAPQRFVREIRVSPESAAEFEAGQQVTTEIFEKGNFVDVVGTSKGRGFTGVIKRHGFSMFPKTHGTHEW